MCGPRCPYYTGIHPIGARSNGAHYNAAAIPQPLAEEVAEHVHSSFYMQRIRYTKQVELTPEQIAEFDRDLNDIEPASTDGA